MESAAQVRNIGAFWDDFPATMSTHLVSLDASVNARYCGHMKPRLFLALSLLLAAALSRAEIEIQGRVVGVTDGDTISGAQVLRV